jgi:hypothetical protein
MPSLTGVWGLDGGFSFTCFSISVDTTGWEVLRYGDGRS